MPIGYMTWVASVNILAYESLPSLAIGMSHHSEILHILFVNLFPILLLYFYVLRFCGLNLLIESCTTT